jgi:YhcH/YjgK/YiaL family protein
MIFDSLANAATYRSLSPAVALGFDWLKQFTPDLPLGRHEIDGDKVFALVQTYETAAPTSKKFESHRTYLDIQYVAAGDEVILYAPLPALTPTMDYDPKRDVILFTDPAASLGLQFKPGDFAIFYPQDGHKPGCLANGIPSTIKKVVIKAKV